jgi:hypothetical protein
MQGETAANAGYHSANTVTTQHADQMAEATIGALSNLATAIASYIGVVEALTQANSCLVKQLEENASELRELKALLNQERRDKRGPRSSTSSASNFCWTHGYKVGKTHTSLLATPAILATKRRPLGLRTWEAVRPTRNDLSGRQL